MSWIFHIDNDTEIELMTGRKSPAIDPEDMPEEPQTSTSESVPKHEPVSENAPTSNSQQTRKKPELTPLQATVELVRRGHRELLPRLRELLAAQPEIFRYVGDLGKQAQRAWVERIGGEGNDLLKESVICYAEELKEKLVGSNATHLEKIAGERIAAAWMETEFFRAWLAQHPEADGTKVGTLYRKRFDEADRRLERALTSLAMIKRLLPKTIEVEVIQKKPVVVPSPAPSVGSTFNGTMPEVDNTRTNQFGGVNRIVGKFNGRSDRPGVREEPILAK